MRIALLSLGTLGLVCLGICEIGLAYPVTWWLYLLPSAAFAAALIRFAPLRSQAGQVAALAALLGVIIGLYSIDWTTRKPFLRDLARVCPGMSEAEVLRIMGGYIRGTGWPAIPAADSSNAPTLVDASRGSRYATGVSPSNELTVGDSLVFRHSTNGRFNADWGIVTLSAGRVVRVEFSPD